MKQTALERYVKAIHKEGEERRQLEEREKGDKRWIRRLIMSQTE